MTTRLDDMTIPPVTAMMSNEVCTNTGDFEAFLRTLLLPRLEPGTNAAMDKPGAHRAKRIVALLEEYGIKVRFTPLYLGYPPVMFPVAAKDDALARLSGLGATVVDEVVHDDVSFGTATSEVPEEF